MNLTKLSSALLLVIVVGVGCRTPEPLGQAEQGEAALGWQNQAPADFPTALELPLHAAIKKGDMDSVRELAVGQAALAAKDPFGATPLHIATANGNLTAVQLLLKAGAKPDESNFGKQTALHFAALNGNEQIAAALIAGGAKVNALDDEHWTPLDCALWKGKGIFFKTLKDKQKVAELLVKHGGKRGEGGDH